MTRDEFMKELAYLLQDIQDEDKSDALQYYTDYFDEAGPDREADVVKELGSPERIAAMIRSDIAGHLEDGGEFTESGYQDERFRDPNYQVARRLDVPDHRDQDWQESHRDGDSRQSHWDGSSRQGHWQAGNRNTSSGTEHNRHNPAPRTNPLLKAILWIVLLIVAVPALFGLGGGVLGIVVGLLGLLIGALVLVGVLTAASLISGIAMIPYGIVHIFTHPLNGFFISGTGLIFLGIGVLLLALAVLFYGRFIPFLIRSIVNCLNRLLHRGRCNP